MLTTSLGKGGNSPVPNDIKFHNNSKSIYVLSSSNELHEYDVQNGSLLNQIKIGKNGGSKLAMNPVLDSVIAVGSLSVKIIDTKTNKSKKLKANYINGISSLVFSKDGKYLLCAGVDSKELLCFDVQASAASDEPLYSVFLPHIPASIAFHSSSDKKVPDALVTYQDSNIANVIRAKVSSNEYTTTISTITTSANILAASFHLKQLDSLLLAIGTGSDPYFITTAYVQQSELMTIVDLSHKLVKDSVNSSSTKPSAVADTSDFSMLDDTEKVGKKRAFQVTDEENNEGNIMKQINSSVELNEETLEMKLEKLSASLNEYEANVVPNAGGTTQLTSDSLITLIEQALQSDDQSLIEQCFACEDIFVLEATTKRLPTNRIIEFLRVLLLKLEKRPSRGPVIIRWLAAILRHHTAYLISVPTLASSLANLSQILERRLSTYTHLAPLKGRLDLVMSQLSTSQSDNRNTSEPVQVYREK